MSASTKLSTSVKALSYLASTHPAPQTSTQIAEHIGTNASKLRRLMSMLSKNEIVKSTQGTSGGFLLNKSPSKIHLQEIYCAIEDRKAFHLDVNKNGGRKNKFPESFNSFFLDLFAEIQVDIENKMKKINLLAVMKKNGIKSTFKM
ncbi:MAG: Rrf2 family transcriptional regulator [Melioribacteraceae bacterium]|nr:Rrf2 family transcriptional regulator [Melioribacteraceae bacterium]